MDGRSEDVRPEALSYRHKSKHAHIELHSYGVEKWNNQNQRTSTVAPLDFDEAAAYIAATLDRRATQCTAAHTKRARAAWLISLLPMASMKDVCRAARPYR
jgi:hypothetical protein